MVIRPCTGRLVYEMGSFIRCLQTKVFSSLSRNNGSGTRNFGVSILLGILIGSDVINNFGQSVNALVFKNGMPDYMEQGRSLIGPGGMILDIPKIRVLRYKVRNTDPSVVSDELECDNDACGNIVEPPLNKLNLGTNSAKEANEWSIPANVTQLVIECKSRSGVVEWEYDGSGVMSEIEIENTRHVGDFWSASTYLHVSLLTFNKISDHLTGKYTCKNVDRSNKSNSFYLFAPQSKSEVVNDGRKIEVIPPSHAHEVVIPCRMEKRNTPIHLFRKSPDGNYRKITLKRGGRFDPYLGFILPLTPDVYGDYACKVDKKRRKKTKREAPPSIAMLPPSAASPEPSPGFLAFPNSAELAEIVKTEEDAAILASLLSSAEQSTVHPDLVYPPVPTVPTNLSYGVQEVASFQPFQRKHRPFNRRRKRPFMRHRHGPNGIASNVLSRRGGPGPPLAPLHSHVGGQLHLPQRGNFLNHRRPVYHRPPMSHLMHQSSSPVYDAQAVPSSGSGNGNLGISSILQQPFHRSHYNGHLHNPPVHSPGQAHPRLPPGPTSMGLLPTFSGGGNLADDKLPGSHEYLSTSPSSSGLNPYQQFIAETLMSRNDVSKSSTVKPPPTKSKPMSLFPQNFLSPSSTVVQTMQCVLKKMVLGADVPCNASLADGIAERHGNTEVKDVFSVTESPQFVKDQKTILEVSVLPPPDNKFYPMKSTIFTTTPFFVKWETKFTDYANWAEANHTLKNGVYKRHRAESVAEFENGINALEIFDIPEGETGNITVTYMGRKKEIKTHTWHYFIINSTTSTNRGLKQTVDGVVKVFRCRSTTSKRPILSLSRLSENGCAELNKDPFSGAQDYTEEDCGPGCTLLRTKIDLGVVKCFGDGVDETLMFPEEMQCTGRPYFIDRGKTKNLTLATKGSRLLLPCVINNPNADVYLFHEENGKFTEVTDNSTYDLKAGFYLDSSGFKNPYGTFVCTSTPDTDDETDMVKFVVKPLEDYVFYPPHEIVYGTPPFKFMWESDDELEVLNGTIGKFDKGMFAKNDGSRPHVGTYEIFGNVTEKRGSEGEVQVVRKSDRKVVHTWRFKNIGKIGLSLDREKNLFKCQAATDNQPMLYEIPCENPNACKLERKYPDEEDEDVRSGRDNSHCGEGCVQLAIWKNKPLGFVKCKGDGVDETLQYFVTENSTIVTEEDKPTMERFKVPEILAGVRRLRVGETVDFICKASRYFYSKGFQWAIETRNGQKKFIDAKVREDVLVRDEVRSIINLKILDAEWKSVWCYTPELSSNNWANISQPIYLR